MAVVQLDAFRNQVAEVQLTYKYYAKPEKQIHGSRDVYEIFRPLYEDVIEYRERAYVMALNYRNRVIAVMPLSDGGAVGCMMDERVIFQMLLKTNATKFALAHNHPSGETSPSGADITITKKLKAGGEIMGIQLIDHLIITSTSCWSMADAIKVKDTNSEKEVERWMDKDPDDNVASMYRDVQEINANHLQTFSPNY